MICEDFHLGLFRGEKVAIVGRNGAEDKHASLVPWGTQGG